MIYGLLGNVDTVQAQMAAIVELVPAEAAAVIEDQLLRIVTTSSGVTGLALSVALFFAIYGAMRAASGTMSALNIINRTTEARPIFKRYLRAAALTIAAIFVAVTGIGSGAVFAWLQTQANFLPGSTAPFLFGIATWLTAIALGSAAFAIIMRYGPDRPAPPWRWLMPGALLATLLWIAVSFGFSFYVAYISDYNATYGSLSAIVVFLMWLFLSAYGVLFGALANAEIEREIGAKTAGPDA